MTRFVALDDIAYETGKDEAGNRIVKSAVVGEVVELNAKDAAALLARGAVTKLNPSEPVPKE